MPPKVPTSRILKPGAAPFQFFDPDGTARTLVGCESIMKYREDFGIPNSDAFDATPPRDWEMKQVHIEDQRESRKRSESEVPNLPVLEDQRRYSAYI